MGPTLAGSLVSGILGDRASQRSADAIASGNAAAIAENRRQFDTILDLTAPQRNVGNAALGALSGILGLPGGTPMDVGEMMSRIPGQDQIISDTIRRIRNAYGASGSTGGNVLAALGDRISGYTGDKVFNSLFQLAGFGPSATGMATNAAGNMGANVGNLMSNTGMANATGIMGSAGSWNNSIQNVLQMLQLQRMLGTA
jgi:hypothetical protein